MKMKTVCNWLKFRMVHELTLFSVHRRFVLFVIFTFFVSLSSGDFVRKLTTSHNPGCEGSICNAFKVIYIRADGPNDTIHHLWDFTQKPTIFIAATSISSKLVISWNQFEEGINKTVMFTEEPVYSFGIVLDKIWEYNDVNDTGLLNRSNTSKNYVQILHMENFNWTLPNSPKINDTYRLELNMEASNYLSADSISVVRGKVIVVLTAFGYLDHSELLPHLLHSANCTQVDLVLDDLKTNSTFSNSRYAVDVLLASNDKANSTAIIDPKKSLDDEHSPGVFTLVDLQTPMASSGRGGYLQWRPVAYIAQERDITNSTEINSYGILDVKNHTVELNKTLLYEYYSSSVDNFLVQSTTLSFGLKEDGFYKKTNFTSWTFMMGYGKPPEEGFSLLVILVISIGLGLPALLIILSGIIVMVRRISMKKDDLFLNR
ncbi:hypothetical protein C0J52_10341 [Blattella germanica]|nr:hypothetical protein C0J52_10341 [Blattella germanica]